MYRVFHWHKWRDAGLLVLVALLAVAGVGEAVLSSRRPAAAVAAETTGTAPAVCLPIIMYHGILEDPARIGRYVISATQFEKDLEYIRSAGYETIVMADLLAYVSEGTPLPEKPIMLTFDDGYYNNYFYAYPLLKKYGMRAVISPVVSWSQQYSDSPQEQDHPVYSHITWAQIREMVESGAVEIQSHSYDMHYCESGKRKGTLKRAGETAEQYRLVLQQDLTTAQQLLTQNAGVTPTVFTYPYGAICDEAKAIIQEMGFRGTLTCESRINRITRQPDCLYGLGRYLRPSGTDSRTYFNKIFTAAQAAQNKETKNR